MTAALHELYISIADPQPPSVNRLYRNGFRGRRVLSKEGASFKAALTAAVVGECVRLPWKQAIDAVYRDGAKVQLIISLHMPIFNGSWKPGASTRKGAPQSPYKKLDGTNYIKCIEDAIAEGTGIDDAAHLTVTVHKLNSPVPFVEVFYEIVER